MSSSIFLLIVVIHFIGDFLFQDVEWANRKSFDNKALTNHTIAYSLIWFVSLYLLNGILSISMVDVVIFSLVTFICHTITDYITSRIVKRMFNEKKYGTPLPNLGGFTVIGFDQVLHYFQLILTYEILFLS